MSLQELRAKGYSMDEGRWLMRVLFLETVAGVPGMVAATRTCAGLTPDVMAEVWTDSSFRD